eukprot:TRINITY_DN527_c0_g1_i1.p1 TRINITY_DN527_c0_g1~~TRINITY_DN527_c0_g1_i1.p1  ORF type:complete len:340 (-),score=95.34 TRINITY_DN527_c0_g1_i1:6-1025(-)
MDNFITQAMQNPMVKQMMSNPEFVKSMINNNPQIQKLLEKNPELRSTFNSPAFVDQMVKMIQNPGLRKEMMRNTDRALANIESLPGGMDALTQMFHSVQEPLYEAFTPSSSGTPTSPSSSNSAPLTQPNSSPLPNPWASPSSNPNGMNPMMGGMGTNMFGMNPMMGMGNLFGNNNNNNNNNNTANAQQDNGQNNFFQQTMRMMMQNPQLMQSLMQNNPLLNGGFNQQQQSQQPVQNQTQQNPFLLPFMQPQQQTQPQLQPQQTQPNPMPYSPFFPNMGFGMNPYASMFGNLQTMNDGQRFAAQLQQLSDMGFTNKEVNIDALKKSNGNVERAVEIMLGL